MHYTELLSSLQELCIVHAVLSFVSGLKTRWRPDPTHSLLKLNILNTGHPRRLFFYTGTVWYVVCSYHDVFPDVKVQRRNCPVVAPRGSH